jgi:hypothetical protein
LLLLIATLLLSLVLLSVVAAQTKSTALRCDLVCQKGSLPRLQRRLARDTIAVLDIDSSSTTAVLRVSMADKRFRRIFHPVLKTSRMARSAQNGFYYQTYLEDYTIPARYRGLIREIRLPDPQLE